MRRFLAISLAWLCAFGLFLLEPQSAAGQFLGQVAIQTVQAQLANNLTCTGSPQNFLTNSGIANFSNLGQTVHQVSATSAAASFTLEIDGIDALGNVVRISNPTISFQPSTSITGYVAQGAGYYPNIQVSVTCTAAATFTLTYSGSTGGSGPGIIATPGTQPLITPTIGADVQGLIPSGLNGIGVYPLLLGGLDPATNLQVKSMGVDIFSVSTTLSGIATLGAPPQPSAPAGEMVFSFFGPFACSGGLTLAAPWTPLNGVACATTGLATADLANYTTKNAPVLSQTMGGQIGQIYVAFKKAPTISNSNFVSSNSAAVTVANTGDTILVGFNCNPTGISCGVTSVTDTFGSSFKTIPFEALGTSVSGNVVTDVFVARANGAGSDTVTVNGATNPRNIALLDFSNVTVADPNVVSTPLFTSLRTAVSNEDDNGGVFTNAGGFDLTQTITLTPAGTTTIALWGQPQNGIFYSCTVALRVTAATGTTPTLDTFLQDSGDNFGFNDRMHFPQATTTGNFLGAVSGGVGGITPAATTDGTLAAASKVDGPLSAFGRIKFVVGGTTPSFTVTYNVACR